MCSNSDNDFNNYDSEGISKELLRKECTCGIIILYRQSVSHSKIYS